MEIFVKYVLIIDGILVIIFILFFAMIVLSLFTNKLDGFVNFIGGIIGVIK